MNRKRVNPLNCGIPEKEKNEGPIRNRTASFLRKGGEVKGSLHLKGELLSLRIATPIQSQGNLDKFRCLMVSRRGHISGAGGTVYHKKR